MIKPKTETYPEPRTFGPYDYCVLSPNTFWIAAIVDGYFMVIQTTNEKVVFKSDEKDQVVFSECVRSLQRNAYQLEWSENSSRIICASPLLQFFFDMNDQKLYICHHLLAPGVFFRWLSIVRCPEAQRRFFIFSIVGDYSMCKRVRSEFYGEYHRKIPIFTEEEMELERNEYENAMCVVVLDILEKDVHIMGLGDFLMYVPEEPMDAERFRDISFRVIQTAHALSPDEQTIFHMNFSFVDEEAYIRAIESRDFDVPWESLYFHDTAQFSISDIKFESRFGPQWVWDKFSITDIVWKHRSIMVEIVIQEFYNHVKLPSFYPQHVISPDESFGYGYNIDQGKRIVFSLKDHQTPVPVLDEDSISITENLLDVYGNPIFTALAEKWVLDRDRDWYDRIRSDAREDSPIGWSLKNEFLFACTLSSSELREHFPNAPTTDQENVRIIYALQMDSDHILNIRLVRILPLSTQEEEEDNYQYKLIISPTGHSFFFVDISFVQNPYRFSIQQHPIHEIFSFPRLSFHKNFAPHNVPLVPISYSLEEKDQVMTQLAMFMNGTKKPYHFPLGRVRLPREIFLAIFARSNDLVEIAKLAPDYFLPREIKAETDPFEFWMHDMEQHFDIPYKDSWTRLYEEEYRRRAQQEYKKFRFARK